MQNASNLSLCQHDEVLSLKENISFVYSFYWVWLCRSGRNKISRTAYNSIVAGAISFIQDLCRSCSTYKHCRRRDGGKSPNGTQNNILATNIIFLEEKYCMHVCNAPHLQESC